jgi:hypothetical protein
MAVVLGFLPALAGAAGDAKVDSAAPGGMSAWLTVPPDVPAGACAHFLTPGRESKVALYDDSTASCPVARVGADTIVLEDLNAALAAAHEAKEEDAPSPHGKAAPKGANVKDVLERLIQIQLLVLEAREMGLERDPLTAEAIREGNEAALVQALERKVIADIRPDEKETEVLYRDAIRQYQITSILCPTREEAQRVVRSTRGAKRFDDVIKETVAAKRCKGGATSDFVKGDDLGVEVLKSARSLKEGQVSGAVAVAKEFVVMRLDRTRLVDDAQARADALKLNLAQRRHRALDDFEAGLIKKYARVDAALLRSLDLEAKKPGFQALAKDKRTLAAIAGEPPITVGMVATAIGKNFFYGMDGPIRDHLVNKLKKPTFERMLRRRLFLKEATAQRLQETPRYLKDSAESTTQQLFGTFMEKVLQPSTKVTEAEAMAYYQQHKAEYTSPRMVRLEGIAFKTQAAAQAAIDKARKGTDFTWLRNNADGQVKAGSEALVLDGSTLSARALPPTLIDAISGSKAGDYRLHAGATQYDLVHVLADTPPQVQPYEETRETIARILYAQNMGKLIKDYADKLRKSVDVKVYLTRIGN